MTRNDLIVEVTVQVMDKPDSWESWESYVLPDTMRLRVTFLNIAECVYYASYR